MSNEIEQVVNKMLEQGIGELPGSGGRKKKKPSKPDFDQVDFGWPDPSPEEPDDEEPADGAPELPYPQGAETQWYGVFHCFSRMDEWSKRVAAKLDTEDIKAAAAILLDLAYFRRPATTRADFNAWRDGTGEAISSYFEITLETPAAQEADNAIALTGEEWNGGVARTKEDAERMFMLSEPGDDTGEWEEF